MAENDDSCYTATGIYIVYIITKYDVVNDL